MIKQHYNLVRVLALLDVIGNNLFQQAQHITREPVGEGQHYLHYHPYSIDPRVTFEQLNDPDWRGPFT